MTKIRQLLHKKHQEVDRWSLKYTFKNGKFSLVDALEPITYNFFNGVLWKEYSGNNKKYPLLHNYRDEEYYKALIDIAKSKR